MFNIFKSKSKRASDVIKEGSEEDLQAMFGYDNDQESCQEMNNAQATASLANVMLDHYSNIALASVEKPIDMGIFQKASMGMFHLRIVFKEDLQEVIPPLRWSPEWTKTTYDVICFNREENSGSLILETSQYMVDRDKLREVIKNHYESQGYVSEIIDGNFCDYPRIKISWRIQ